MNNVIKGAKWYYECVNRTMQSVKVLTLPYSVIYNAMQHDKQFDAAIDDYNIYINTQGLPQIDYHIDMEQVSADDIRAQVKNFRAKYRWQLKNPENYDVSEAVNISFNETKKV